MTPFIGFYREKRAKLMVICLDRERRIRYTPAHGMAKHAAHQSGGRVDRDERRERKAQMIGGMLEGGRWREATERAGIPTSQTAAYRLLRLVRTDGDCALEERRHGHPYKVTPSVREWLIERCRGTPGLSGRVLCAEIEERFGVGVSITHINRLRAELGVSNASRFGGENQQPSDEPIWREGAGSLLLLAAAHQTGLIDALEAALPEYLPADNGKRHHKDPGCPRSLLLTLLFLPAVGLRRTYDFRGYTGDALALLSGRDRAYSYRHVERFLSAVARAGGTETLTNALAGWTAKLWGQQQHLACEPPPAYYIDGHRKAVHSDKLVPRGLVSRYGKVLGCRALMLLHDEHGHPLLATTYREEEGNGGRGGGRDGRPLA